MRKNMLKKCAETNGDLPRRKQRRKFQREKFKKNDRTLVVRGFLKGVDLRRLVAELWGGRIGVLTKFKQKETNSDPGPDNNLA